MPSFARELPVKKLVLPNGLTVLHQRNPFSRSFCIGLWTHTGSRDERPGEEGLCHFFEHMLFKGTARRSAFDISHEIERVGGSLDAFTTKETMCVFARVLESQKTLAFDVISDMTTNSAFPADQVPRERQVVLQEIGDVKDAPDDLIHDLFSEVVFPDHPLGQPILGYPKSVGRFSRHDLVRFSRRTFRGSNLVLCVYGNIDGRALRSAAERLFQFRPGRTALRGGRLRGDARRKMVRRKLHQQHVCLGRRTFSYHEDRRVSLMVLTALLGGGMSSRLFQRIREELGLAYSVFTYAEYARDTGMMATYMAVSPKRAGTAIAAVMEEYDKLIRGNLDKDELSAIKEQLKGGILLGLETSTAKMMRMARNELSFGRQTSEKDLIRRIDAVTLDDIHEVASLTLEPDKLSMVSLGPSSAGLRA